MTYPFTKRQPPVRTDVCVDIGLFTIENTCKDQAMKIFEEAAEVYSALEDYTHDVNFGEDATDSRKSVLEECTDVITAAMNTAYSLGFSVEDIKCAISECTIRNALRGRLDEKEEE